ncbi:MAG: carboxypeptidase-like regulatory domain-containing protein [Bacteroidales bacterium]
MLSAKGRLFNGFAGLFFLAIFAWGARLQAQTGILDSAFTVRAGTVKISSALNILSRQTGYYFTYDSKLINTDAKKDVNFVRTPLSNILDELLSNDSLRYSVINKYIIIYKYVPSEMPKPETVPDWETRTITGTITDNETNEPLPFATIGIVSKGRGTVTNNNGIFDLKITRDDIKDSLTVSYLGYYNRRIPVKQAIGNNFNIKMMREYISIPEIIIRNQVPYEIVRKAYTSIGRNYGNTPAYLTAFYREAAMKKDALQNYSEAILKIFKSSYLNTLLGDQVKVIRSRKIENLESTDTLAVRLKAGLSSSLQLDGARNTFDFLHPDNYAQYDYRMTDIVTIDGESAFVVDFVQKATVDIPLFRGTMYINTSDYAIVQAEFEMNPRFIHRDREEFVTYQAKGYKVWPVTMKYSVSYRKFNDRYYLSHVRGDLTFSARKNNRLFNSSFIVFFELAVTELTTDNVTRFDREELAPIHSVFSRTISNYDQSFWGDMDFLRPEENLLQALKNMKARLLEFSK